MGPFYPKYIMFQLEHFRGIMCHDTKGDAKFKGKLTPGLKNDISNLDYFHASSRKSENLHFDGLLLSKTYKDLEKKSTEELCLVTLTTHAKFEEKLTLGSKKDMRNFVSFNVNSGETENLHFDVILLSIAYKVSAKKVQKNYIS